MSWTSGLATTPDPNMRPGAYPSAKRLTETERILRGSRGIGSTRVRLRPWGLEIGGGGAGVDYSKFCFGFSIAGATVTVKIGEVHWGRSNATALAADAAVPLTADYQYIGIEFDPSGPSVVCLAPNANKAVFVSDSAKFRCWLHQFRLNEGLASLYRIGHIGNVEIPGWFGG